MVFSKGDRDIWCWDVKGNRKDWELVRSRIDFPVGDEGKG